MLKLYTAADRTLVGFLKSVLEDHRIPCIIRNEFVGGGVGEIPPQECWPELWLIDESDERRARQIIEAAWPSKPVRGAPWQCAWCGEWLEAQFETCWHCGAEQDRHGD